MLTNSKDNTVRIYPLTQIQELVYHGYPSEEDLKVLYENNFILIRIVNDEYYFMDKNGDENKVII